MLYSRYTAILASNVVLARFFKIMVYFNVECHFMGIMKIYTYERSICIEDICSQRSPRLTIFPNVLQMLGMFPNAPKGFSMFTMLHGVPLHCFKVLTTYEPLEYICVPSLMHINYLYYMTNWTFKIP